MVRIGKVVAANNDLVVIKKQMDAQVELGSLLYISIGDSKAIYQVYEMEQGSQMQQREREYLAEMLNEEGVEIKDKALRSYVLIKAKPLVLIVDGSLKHVKLIPEMYADAYELTDELAETLLTYDVGIGIGKLRSGSQELEAEVRIDAIKLINHHIFIGATTGRGKSNLLKVMVLQLLNHAELGMVIFDPHDEYIGRGGEKGLKDLNSQEVIYFSSQPLTSYPYYRTLVFDIRNLKPSHFMSVFEYSEAQQQALYLLWKVAKEEWVEKLLNMQEQDDTWKFLVNKGNVDPRTLEVLKRKVMVAINAGFEVVNDEIRVTYQGIFKKDYGETMLKDLLNMVEQGKKVIVDTSALSYTEELLVSGVITEELLRRYKAYKKSGKLKEKAKVAIVLEEAPRVLGKETLKKDGNIFGTIAREGRKFNIGLIAITQLPSLIPDEILANMNTKIILGMEMNREREAIIASAPHDLSKDSKVIASLEKGEAIITSIFTGFPIPVKVYRFEDLLQERKEESKTIVKGFSTELEI